MSFLAGWRLIFLLAVVGLGIAYVLVQRQRQPYAVRFTNVDLLASVAPRHPSWRRHLAASLLLLALALSVVAFARPTRAESVPRERATVMLAFDVSRSMAATDVAPTRLRAARAAADLFVAALPKRFRIGLVTFAGSANVVVAPTTNHARVSTALRHMRLAEQTAIGEGIFSSLGAIENDPSQNGARKQKVPSRIVLLSDGATNSGRPNEQAAAAAAALKVPVSTIAFGTETGTVQVGDTLVPVPVDKGALQQIADTTGGKFASAATASEVRGVYQDLGESIAYRTVHREVTMWFVGAALLFAFLAAAASLLWTSRLP